LISRFANLPLAVRLAAAFGLQAVALLLVTVLALNAFGNFRNEVHGLSTYDVRAVSLAGEVGQHIQSIGRLATEHLYVYDGDLKSQDQIAARIKTMSADAQGDAKQLAALLESDPNIESFSEQATVWGHALDEALAKSRAETVSGTDNRTGSRDLYTGRISPGMDQLFKTLEELQDSVQANTQATNTHVAAQQGARKRLLLIVVGLSLLLATAFAVLITRSVVRPVHALMSRLRSLDEHCLTDLTGGLEAAATGDFTHAARSVTTPFDVRSTDELGQLGSTFNAMLAKAQRSVAGYSSM
jgi:nitrogen fixation/metabolism regulation signal transduction histidine kinase